MRSAKKVGHDTVKLDKKMSARIRKAMPAQDIVFVPEIVECEGTTMAEIRLDILIALVAFTAGWGYFQIADRVGEEWRAGMESETISTERAWNLHSAAMSYRGIGFALCTAAAAFFGTGMAFYLQSRPRKSDAILTTQLKLIRRELRIMQGQLQQVVELLRS